MSRAPWLLARVCLLLLLAVLLLGCTGNRRSVPHPTPDPVPQTQEVPVEGGGSYTDVSVAGLAKMLQNKDFLFVNVHVPYEGEIEPTDLFLPYNKIDKHLDKLPSDHAARIVLYCRSGGMSAIAARELVRRGYTDVWNLDGGFVAWKAAGYPLVKKAR